jgi:hypothetical protein
VSKRKPRELLPDGKINAPVLTHMRGVAFDPKPTRMYLNKLDKLHNDDAALAAAQAKRDRKAAAAKARTKV